ncbi:cysteine hydrolase family protein [Peribacillus kribbensis]|uniref:cysteine hydrolase family protein n=1 Tax=Peribacillus kribbensis TaxID=356658 RepID=UPI000410ACB7|nr:cysteine hydrolase family protein [Peribacillus kribbensis]
MLKLGKNTALVVIDVQKGFDSKKWGTRNNPQAEEQISRLLSEWRRREYPVIHTQHLSVNPESPLYPGQDGAEIKDIAAPRAGEAVFQKNVNSAFIGTGLEEYLRENDIDTLIITGLITPHCVSTTARMSGNLGFSTFVVSDAAASFDITSHDGTHYTADQIHQTSLAALHEEFATILTTDEIIGE